jgi:hypothetical protein
MLDLLILLIAALLSILLTVNLGKDAGSLLRFILVRKVLVNYNGMLSIFVLKASVLNNSQVLSLVAGRIKEADTALEQAQISLNAAARSISFNVASLCLVFLALQRVFW